jgi:hypothetical protein
MTKDVIDHNLKASLAKLVEKLVSHQRAVEGED